MLPPSTYSRTTDHLRLIHGLLLSQALLFQSSENLFHKSCFSSLQVLGIVGASTVVIVVHGEKVAVVLCSVVVQAKGAHCNHGRKGA